MRIKEKIFFTYYPYLQLFVFSITILFNSEKIPFQMDFYYPFLFLFRLKRLYLQYDFKTRTRL